MGGGACRFTMRGEGRGAKYAPFWWVKLRSSKCGIGEWEHAEEDVADEYDWCMKHELRKLGVWLEKVCQEGVAAELKLRELRPAESKKAAVLHETKAS